jgi:hypothetical protein
MSFNPNYFVEYEISWEKFLTYLNPKTEGVVFRIEAPELMGKSWLLYRMKTHCESEGIAVIHLDFSDLPEDVADIVGWIDLFARIFEAPEIFAPLDRERTTYHIIENQKELPVLVRLCDYLLERFPSLDSLTSFAQYQLDLILDDLPDETRPDKLYQLILHCFKKKQMPVLFAALEKEFDSVQFNWSPFEGDLAKFSPIFDAGVAVRGGFQDYTPAQVKLFDVLFDCLTDYIKANGKTVVLMDSYNKATPEVENWLVNFALPKLDTPILRTLVVVVASVDFDENDPLSPQASRVFNRRVADLIEPRGGRAQELAPFAKEQVREYIEDRRKLPQDDLFSVDIVYHNTDGIPGEVASIADRMERKLKRSGSRGSNP